MARTRSESSPDPRSVDDTGAGAAVAEPSRPGPRATTPPTDEGEDPTLDDLVTVSRGTPKPTGSLKGASASEKLRAMKVYEARVTEQERIVELYGKAKKLSAEELEKRVTDLRAAARGEDPTMFDDVEKENELGADA